MSSKRSKKGTKRPVSSIDPETSGTASAAGSSPSNVDSDLEERIVSRIATSLSDIVAPLEKRIKLLEATCSASSAEGGPQLSTATASSQPSGNYQTIDQVDPNINHSAENRSNNPSTMLDGATRDLTPHQTPISLISGVSDQVRSKIWEMKYVDLGQLIFKQDTTLKFATPYHSDSPEVIIQHKASRSIKTFDEWDTAFARFHSIFIQKYPLLSEFLIAHQQQVKKIAVAKGDWAGYDESHRRAVADGAIRWGQINPHLTIEAMLLNRPVRPATKEYASSSYKGVPRGYCWSYHSDRGCNKTTCDFKHQCPRCGQKHTVLTCKSKGSSYNTKETREGPASERKRSYKC